MLEFGTMPEGAAIHRITLANDALEVHLLTYGACLQDLRLTGVPHSLTFGFPTLTPYLSKFSSCGTIMGPVANRISTASTEIDGAHFEFDRNFLDAHTLHGGSAAFHKRVWDVLDHTKERATLRLACADGEGGFPGRRTVTATFALDEAALTLTLTATTDAPTILNLANHSYWNLGPEETTQGHTLTVAADHHLPGDPESTIPTGEIRDVAGTRFDYREGRAIEAGAEGLLDVNLCTATSRVALRNVATLTGPTGVTMTMDSTEPGLQVFDGHILGRETHKTNDGRVSQPYGALALEAQFWPDAPNKPDFPSITFRPEDTWQQITRWSFYAPT